MSVTKIAWAEETLNPLTGCERVSEGCRNCYAERLTAGRLKQSPKYQGKAEMVKRRGHKEARWTGVLGWHRSALTPLHYPFRKPKRFFIASMSDLFWDAVSDAMLDEMFSYFARADARHQILLLTKRPERAKEYLNDPDTRQRIAMYCRDYSTIPWPLPHVWLGTSIEDQRSADERIPYLLACRAARRFISFEPGLEGVDLAPALAGYPQQVRPDEDPHPFIRTAPPLDLVIVGGESGPRARAFNPNWARAARDQCAEAGVCFFMKQLGERAIHDDGQRIMTPFPSDKARKNLESIPSDLRIRQWPEGIGDAKG